MRLETESYQVQRARWPASGRAILAQYDEASVVVYQAYRPSIGHFAVEHQHFGGDFSLNRMTWIKPNFLWMMYRSSWGTSEGQQVVLAIRLRRAAFDHLLEAAVHSSFVAEVYGEQHHWKQRVKTSDVRLQWDPDHAPNGAKLERRAIQLGIRGESVERYAREWIVEIIDVSPFVAEQRARVVANDIGGLVTPKEDVYPAPSIAVAEHLGLTFGIPPRA